MTRRNPIQKLIDDFQEGMISGVTGFTYSLVIQALLGQFLGPYIPIALISAAMFIVGVISSANDIVEQRHAFVLGSAFITWYLDPIGLVVGFLCFALGWSYAHGYLESLFDWISSR